MRAGWKWAVVIGIPLALVLACQDPPKREPPAATAAPVAPAPPAKNRGARGRPASAAAKAKEAQSRVDAEQLNAAESKLKYLRDSGLLKRLDLDSGVAAVDRGQWHGMNLDTRQGVAYTLALYRSLKGQTGQISIQDNRTGKDLATYGLAQGYSDKE